MQRYPVIATVPPLVNLGGIEISGRRPLTIFNVADTSINGAVQQVRDDINGRDYRQPEKLRNSTDDFCGPDIDETMGFFLQDALASCQLELFVLSSDWHELLAVQSGSGDVFTRPFAPSVSSQCCMLDHFTVICGGMVFHIWAQDGWQAIYLLKDRIYLSRNELGTRHGREISYSFVEGLRHGAFHFIAMDGQQSKLLCGERSARLSDVLDNGDFKRVVLDRRLKHLCGGSVKTLRDLDPGTWVHVLEQPVTRGLATLMRPMLSPDQFYSAVLHEEVATA